MLSLLFITTARYTVMTALLLLSWSIYQSHADQLIPYQYIFSWLRTMASDIEAQTLIPQSKCVLKVTINKCHPEVPTWKPSVPLLFHEILSINITNSIGDKRTALAESNTPWEQALLNAENADKPLEPVV